MLSTGQVSRFLLHPIITQKPPSRGGFRCTEFNLKTFYQNWSKRQDSNPRRHLRRECSIQLSYARNRFIITQKTPPERGFC